MSYWNPDITYNEFGLMEPPFIRPGTKCLICQRGFHWPTPYWPVEDDYGNWFHSGCWYQPRPYMLIPYSEEALAGRREAVEKENGNPLTVTKLFGQEQYWVTATEIWWEVCCEGK